MDRNVPDEEEKKNPTKKISSSGGHNPFVQSNKKQGRSNKQIWRCNVLLMVRIHAVLDETTLIIAAQGI